MRTLLFHTRFYAALATLLILLHLPNLSQAQCVSCTATGATWTVSSSSATNYTVGTGQYLYITTTGTVTGTITLNGGTICNAGTFTPAAFTYTTGTFNNNGVMSLNATLNIAAGTFSNCSTGRLRINGSTTNFKVTGTCNNYGFISLAGTMTNTGTTSNYGRIICIGLTNNGTIYDYCHIQINGNYVNSGYVHGGSSQVGRINVTGTSSNSSSFGATGQLDFCDASSSNGGRFDTNTGTVNASVTYCTRSASGCQLSVPVVTLTATPSATTSGPGVCTRLNAAVSGGFIPYTYSWNGATATAIDTNRVCPNVTTTYTVLVTDAAGSTATQTLTVTVGLVISESITNATSSNANAGAITLSIAGGKSPFIYLWENNSTASSRTGLSAGIYSVTVTDAAGQTKQKTIYVGNRITWAAPVGGNQITSTTEGDQQTRSGGGSDWCNGNSSSNNLFTVSETSLPNKWLTCSVVNSSGFFMIGFVSAVTVSAPEVQNYRLMVRSDSLSVIELDQDGYFTKKYLGAVANGDQLRIEFKSDGIKYYRNNQLIYTTLIYGAGVYHIETDIYTGGIQLREIRTNASYTP